MKVEQLTFTRFLAALIVLFFHFHKTGFFQNGYVFVSFFYILSGFVLMVSQKTKFSSRKEILEFYRNRFARVYPVYLFSILLFVIVQQTIGWGVILNVLAIQSFFPDNALTYNAPGWSISVEFFFYFSFPFLVLYFFNRVPLKFILFTSFCFWLLCQILFASIFYSEVHKKIIEVRYFLLYNPLNHLNSFICGGVTGLLYNKYHKKWIGNYDLFLLLLFALVYLYSSWIRNSLEIFDHNGLLMIFFAPIILLLALNDKGTVTKIFKNRILIFAGEISFSFYILSEPLHLMLQKFPVIFNIIPLPHFFTFSLILLIASCVIHFLLEKPIQRKIRNTDVSAFKRLLFR